MTVPGTSDLSDEHGDDVQVLELHLRSYGGRRSFHGEVVTVKCFEDHSRVKELAGTPGAGKVLAVDGGGSLRHALLGDLIGAEARRPRVYADADGVLVADRELPTA